jgi:hypothetical protein
MPHQPGYLIQYGKPGFVGRFRSARVLARGDRVVIDGPRGVEVGDVLVALPDASDPDGEVLDRAAAVDAAEHDYRAGRAAEVLDAAVARAEQLALPLAFVDVELTLDGSAVLHALPWAACDATALLDELAARFRLAVRLLDLSRTPAAREPAGCGKPGCGSEAGGCSTCGTGGCSSGSCSRGAVKTPAELTAYFADLRRQMEAAGVVRTPLN